VGVCVGVGETCDPEVFLLLAMVMGVYTVIASILYKIGMQIPVVDALGVRIGKMLWPV